MQQSPNMSQHHSTSCRRRSQSHNHACMRTRPYAHAYARTRADTRTHTYAHTHTHAHTHACTHAYAHAHTRIHAHTTTNQTRRHWHTYPPIGRVPTGKPRGRCDSSSDAGCDLGLLRKSRSFPRRVLFFHIFFTATLAATLVVSKLSCIWIVGEWSEAQIPDKARPRSRGAFLYLREISQLVEDAGSNPVRCGFDSLSHD